MINANLCLPTSFVIGKDDEAAGGGRRGKKVQCEEGFVPSYMLS